MFNRTLCSSDSKNDVFHHHSHPSSCLASVFKIISAQSTVCCLSLTTVIIFTSVLLKLLFGSAERTRRDNSDRQTVVKKPFKWAVKICFSCRDVLAAHCKAYTNIKRSDVRRRFVLLRIYDKVQKVGHKISSKTFSLKWIL